MRSFVLALVALFSFGFASAQTNVQFQAHLPFTATEVTFSAYIADSTFNETSRLNTDAIWYVENKTVASANGMINVELTGIPDSVFRGNFGKIWVYSYVNGQSLGKLPFHKLPYALFANSSEVSGRADVATFAQDARFAERADTATLAFQADNARRSDTATFSVTSRYSFTSDTATYARNAGYAVGADGARLAQEADHSKRSDTALYSYNSGLSSATNFVNENGVNTLSIRNGVVVTEKIADNAVTSTKLGVNSVQNQHVGDNAITLDNIDGNMTAPIGSYLTKGVGGISWQVNPQHRTSSVSIFTSAPNGLGADSRWVVSRVAVDYNLATVSNPVTGQLITIYNGSTANIVTLNAVTWGIDTGLNCVISAGQSRTLWYNGFVWVVIG